MSRIHWSAEEKSGIVTDIVAAMIEKKQTPRDLEVYNRLLLRHLRAAQRTLQTCRRRDASTISAFPWLLPAISTVYQKTITGVLAPQAPQAPQTHAQAPQVTQAERPTVKVDHPVQQAATPVRSDQEESLEDMAANLARALVKRYTRFLEANGAAAQQDLVSSILLLTESVSELRATLKPEAADRAPAEAETGGTAVEQSNTNGYAANGHAANGHAANGNIHIHEQHEEVRQKPKVVLFGLEKNQAKIIENSFGHAYKLYFKKQAQTGDMPQADLVIVTRFMRHAVTDLCKNVYDKDIMHWCSGLTEIQDVLRSKRHILTSRQPKMVADATS